MTDWGTSVMVASAMGQALEQKEISVTKSRIETLLKALGDSSLQSPLI